MPVFSELITIIKQTAPTDWVGAILIYARCKRLMKKHDITMTRDLSYWDFSEPVGTCGMNENVDCWTNAYVWLCARLLELGLEPVDHSIEEDKRREN